MSTVKEALKCALLILLVVATAWAIRIEMTVSAAAEAFPAQLGKRLDTAVLATDRRLSDALALADKRIGVLITLADKRTAEALMLLDPLNASLVNLSAITGEVAGELRPGGDAQAAIANAARATGDLDRAAADIPIELARLNATIATTARPLAESAQQVDDALPLFLDCDHNPDCLFNRYQGVSKSIEKVGISSQGIAFDIKREADQLTKPQTFWGQVKSWLLTLARIYGAI